MDIQSLVKAMVNRVEVGGRVSGFVERKSKSGEVLHFVTIKGQGIEIQMPVKADQFGQYKAGTWVLVTGEVQNEARMIAYKDKQTQEQAQFNRVSHQVCFSAMEVLLTAEEAEQLGLKGGKAG